MKLSGSVAINLRKGPDTILDQKAERADLRFHSPDIAKPDTTSGIKPGRLLFIDFTRGIVMILMAWDHVSGFWNRHHRGGEGVLGRMPSFVNFTWFILRFVTHWCALTFIFLAGTALAFSTAKRLSRGESDAFLVSAMTGSIVGGLNSVYGTIFDGIFVTMAQKIISNLLVHLFGIEINWWIGLLPIIFLYMVLNATPDGITGIKGDRFSFIHDLRVRLKRMISDVADLLKADKRAHERAQ